MHDWHTNMTPNSNLYTYSCIDMIVWRMCSFQYDISRCCAKLHDTLTWIFVAAVTTRPIIDWTTILVWTRAKVGTCGNRHEAILTQLLFVPDWRRAAVVPLVGTLATVMMPCIITCSRLSTVLGIKQHPLYVLRMTHYGGTLELENLHRAVNIFYLFGRMIFLQLVRM